MKSRSTLLDLVGEIYFVIIKSDLNLYELIECAGFSSGALRACCGAAGPYNFNISARCGHIGSKVCADPSTHANWDGIHLTEASYRYIAKGLIYGPFSYPPLKTSLYKIP